MVGVKKITQKITSHMKNQKKDENKENWVTPDIYELNIASGTKQGPLEPPEIPEQS